MKRDFINKNFVITDGINMVRLDAVDYSGEKVRINYRYNDKSYTADLMHQEHDKTQKGFYHTHDDGTIHLVQFTYSEVMI